MAKKENDDWLGKMLRDNRAKAIAEDELYSQPLTAEDRAELENYPQDTPEGYAKIGFQRFFVGD